MKERPQNKVWVTVCVILRFVSRICYQPGTRLDWVLSCSSAGKYEIWDISAPITSVNVFEGMIAYIEVSGAAVQSADVPTSLVSITKPYYLQDQTDAEVDSEHSINFSQVLHIVAALDHSVFACLLAPSSLCWAPLIDTVHSRAQVNPPEGECKVSAALRWGLVGYPACMHLQ